MEPIQDTFITLEETAEGLYTEKRSKFISYIVPVESEQEALDAVDKYRKQYYDARHVCWAYRLGYHGSETRANDDGEPSSTAGKPILRRLVAANVTNVVAIVIRYFGGVKLGTGGLGVAYRTAVEEALAAAKLKEVIRTEEFRCHFSYPLMGEVMRIVKDSEANIIQQDFRETCSLHLQIRCGQSDMLKKRLENLYGVNLSEIKS